MRDLIAGKLVHCQSIKIGFMMDIVVSNSLISMYGKCGEFEAMKKVFDEMCERNVGSWNELVSGYSNSGDWRLMTKLVLLVQSNCSPVVRDMRKPKLVPEMVDPLSEKFQVVKNLNSGLKSSNSLIKGLIEDHELYPCFDKEVMTLEISSMNMQALTVTMAILEVYVFSALLFSAQIKGKLYH
ncbi:hypothetical protein F3Y22_tig00111000pilonHSYRG00249 [Hibiscus syriacus]|uniref:Pentatricopeptide repeat-containing protein n=1 Tax=Hibiscus syriacus TaxID=106335 RepID=A0A6A2Z932_HIBSY|nr:hypothetical protein F3Y22_tig00111000pilonHSYRG00249 [Hibiscus syriacus]